MASGVGISSNGGQGAEQHPHDIIPEVEEFMSDISSESDMEVDVPRVGRRRISVRDDETRTRRRIAKAELDGNLALLRSILPQRTGGTTAAARTRDRNPVGYPVQELANMHILQLHRNLQGVLSGMHLPRVAIIEGFSRENPIVRFPPQTHLNLVEVEVLRDPLRENGHLNLKITSVIRSGLLIDLLAFLQQKNLNLLDGSSIVNLENAFYANLHLEKFTPETPVGVCSEPRPEPRPEPQPEPLPESEEDEALKQAVIRLIRQDIPAGTSNNAN